jgi:hypothetical protein
MKEERKAKGWILQEEDMYSSQALCTLHITVSMERGVHHG